MMAAQRLEPSDPEGKAIMKRLACIIATVTVVVLVATWSRTDSPPAEAPTKNGLRIQAEKVMEQRWHAQFGRLYYHFVYKDVLFLLLNTEDPPKTKVGNFGADQIAWAKKVLEDNAGVRWSLVFLHRPIWAEKEVAKTGWLDIEKTLTGRKYTVFAGHRHFYKRFERNGARYYQLATTGGA